MAVGGDLLQGTYNHPTLGTGTLYYKSGEDSTLSLGGYQSADDAGGVDASGEMIDVMTAQRWSVEGTLGWDLNNREELENLQSLQSDPEPADWTFSHVSGVIYAGRGKPVGDLSGKANNATMSLKVQGGGKLAKL